jgi:hypothetical protein
MTDASSGAAVTAAGRPISWYVDQEVREGRWREEEIAAAVVGLTRPLTVFRGPRKTGLIAHEWHGDEHTFCPPMWWDLAIGSGACGLGCRSCVGQDTWVYTDRGPVRVQELHARFRDRHWMVLGYDDMFRAVWTPLLATRSRQGPSSCLSIKLDTGHQVRVTSDHPMIVARPGCFEGWDGSFPAERIAVDDWLPIVQKAPPRREEIPFLNLLTLEWKTSMKVKDTSLAQRLPSSTTEIAKRIGQHPRPADRKYPLTEHARRGFYDLQEYKNVLHVTGLEPDNRLLICPPSGHGGVLRNEIVLDRTFGFLLGHYLAEGSRSKREIALAVHQREAKAVCERWAMFCDAPIAATQTSKHGVTLRIAHTTLASLFGILVPGNAFTKRFPQCVWQAPQAFAEGLLEGLFFGDGHLDHFGTLVYATCSEGMAADTRLLLWQLGYSPTVVRNNYRGDKVTFHVRIQQQDATCLVRQLNLAWRVEERERSMVTQRYPYALLMRRKGATWGATGATRWRQRVEAGTIELSEWGRQVVCGDLGLARVRDVESVSSTNTLVYDLQTGTGNFVAGDGILVHNCFLMLTHRIRRDPMRHLLYDNVQDFVFATEKWLKDPARRRQHTLGVGIDRSDSLLYEGVTGHVRSLAPLFGGEAHNPAGNKLVLLTKSANTGYLAEIAPEQRGNIVVTFSLNPEPVADLWEGKWPDTGERITPSIARRLQAVRDAQDLGFEVRVRVDPILTPDGWQDLYAAFIAQVKAMGITFTYWTLGTYREKNHQLDGWRQRWGLPAMEWQPGEEELVQDGTHRHLPASRRIEIYTTVRDLIKREFALARVSLCKETHDVRRRLALCNADCNCLR